MNLDLTLSFDKRIVNTVRKFYFHMRTLRHIRLRPLMPKLVALSVRVLITATACSMACLSRIVSRCKPFRAIYSPRRLRRSLHWLLMRQHVDNKVANRKFKARQQLCVLIVTLWSSSCNMLYHPVFKTNVVASTVWNSFYYELVLLISLDCFKSEQKTQ